MSMQLEEPVIIIGLNGGHFHEECSFASVGGGCSIN